MGNILVRNFDDDVIAILKDQAKSNQRSLANEIRYLLTEHVERRAKMEKFREFSKRVADSTAATQRSDSVDLIREDRNRSNT